MNLIYDPLWVESSDSVSGPAADVPLCAALDKDGEDPKGEPHAGAEEVQGCPLGLTGTETQGGAHIQRYRWNFFSGGNKT